MIAETFPNMLAYMSAGSAERCVRVHHTNMNGKQVNKVKKIGGIERNHLFISFRFIFQASLSPLAAVLWAASARKLIPLATKPN